MGVKDIIPNRLVKVAPLAGVSEIKPFPELGILSSELLFILSPEIFHFPLHPLAGHALFAMVTPATPLAIIVVKILKEAPWSPRGQGRGILVNPYIGIINTYFLSFRTHSIFFRIASSRLSKSTKIWVQELHCELSQ